MPLKTQYRHVHFEPSDDQILYLCSDKIIYDVVQSTNTNYFGQIFWDNPYQQYCYRPPMYHVAIRKECLDDIGDFIKQLMDERKS